MRNEVTDENVSTIFIDNVLESDIVPGKLDDVFPRILHSRVMVLDQQSGQLKKFHSGMVNSKLN